MSRKKDEGSLSVDASPFKTYDLPPELLALVSKEEIVQNTNVSALDVVSTWLGQSAPTVSEKQNCQNMLGGRMDKKTTEELFFCAKLACIAYSMPYFMSAISTHLHFRNSNFWKYLGTLVAESTFVAYDTMDRILEDKANHIQLPRDAQLAGFYVRSPIKIWNTRNVRVYDIPKWADRMELLKYKITGNVNVYILRQNFETYYECYVLFRGTSNEFNSLPQYGKGMQNTQLYSIPCFDPLTGTVHETGSTSKPLFFEVYSQMVLDVMPHIMQCLTWLQAMDEKCRRVVVSGHSMGAAMVQHFCYILKHKDPQLWTKTFFRSYAAPMTGNYAAVKQLEQWIIDSKQANKYIEVINKDDFVNIQFNMGGKEGIKTAVREGSKTTAAWLLQSYLHDAEKTKTTKYYAELIKSNPEVAFSAFMRGALTSQMQHLPKDKRAAFRLGQRAEEIKLWQTSAINHLYKGTLKLFYCERNVDWKTEYFGKSHANYMDINMNILWSVLRSYEDGLYKYYAKHGLQTNNNLHILPLFPAKDLAGAEALVKDYEPLTDHVRVVRKKRSD